MSKSKLTKSEQKEFEEWVLRTYQRIDAPPENMENKFVYKINGINYGPIYYHDVPVRFRK